MASSCSAIGDAICAASDLLVDLLELLASASSPGSPTRRCAGRTRLVVCASVGAAQVATDDAIDERDCFGAAPTTLAKSRPPILTLATGLEIAAGDADVEVRHGSERRGEHVHRHRERLHRARPSERGDLLGLARVDERPGRVVGLARVSTTSLALVSACDRRLGLLDLLSRTSRTASSSATSCAERSSASASASRFSSADRRARAERLDSSHELAAPSATMTGKRYCGRGALTRRSSAAPMSTPAARGRARAAPGRSAARTAAAGARRPRCSCSGGS